jgi:RNA polymerase sigma-70 factor (ECF subfamily)
MQSSDYLFRHESGRMVASLTRIFGVHNLALAEDVVQDAFCRALEVWKFRGMPDNPSAWLMAAAKNRALDTLRRQRSAERFAPELERLLRDEELLAPGFEDLLSARAIKDDVLRMMFSCCHPRLAEEAQVALILNILCGFSASEVAAAFLGSLAAIEKRITRAKKTLAASKRLFDVTDNAQFAQRLAAVQRALYLLFSEGYHGASPNASIRAELCHEAMRLTAALMTHPSGSTPATRALAAIMCFSAARLPSRLDQLGNLIPLARQDRSLWDQELIGEGARFLELSACEEDLTDYHIEAAIAAIHACASAVDETDWQAVVALYDTLIRVRPSPVVALNRAIAVAERDGPERGKEELAAIADGGRLASYPFFSAALGEFELRCGRRQCAQAHFKAALTLARNPAERHFLKQRLNACEPGRAAAGK